MSKLKKGVDNHLSLSHMILQRDLNPHETLFAGQAASYLVECGFLEAMDYLQTKHLVCQGLDGLRFLQPVHKGEAITLTTSVVSLGKTSVGILVELFIIPQQQKAAECFVTFVTINEETGRAVPHNMEAPTLENELEKKAKRYQALRKVPKK